MSSASFAQSSAGGALIGAWETEKQIYFGRIDPSNGKVSKPTPAPGTGPNRKHPAVAINGQGETLLVWTEGTAWQRGGTLAWQVFDTAGRATGEKGSLPGGIGVWSLATAIAGPDGRFIIFH